MASLFLKDLISIEKIGKKRSEIFKLFGVSNIGDLLYFFPKTYIDLSNPLKIKDAPFDKFCCLKAIICSDVISKKISNRVIYKLKISNNGAKISVVFFNNPYVLKILTFGNEFLFFGKINNFFGNLTMICPKFFKISEKQTIIPVYKKNTLISSKMIEITIKKAIDMLPEKINDSIPFYIRKEFDICSLEFAIKNIHFPKKTNDIFTSRKYFAFEQALVFWLKLNKISVKNKKNNRIIKKDYSEEFASFLHFGLTDAQKRCIKDCFLDMKNKSKSMQRLIQGDVGSGKTVVAASVCYNCFKNGFQAAIMVPTEILAMRHLEYFKNFPFNTEVLTSSTKSKKKQEILNNLKNGTINVLIGTHSIISECVIFKNLGLVVIDEQHRFGVNQRADLSSKRGNPHILIMTATPIPRTLALTFYGSVDISLLNELPKGRQKINTFFINSKKRESCFHFVKNLIDKGQRGYIVCPAIEESETLTSASDYYKIISNGVFKNYKIALLHGKMKDEEKNKIINDFANKKIDLLVSTTIIEVGIDIKDASFIIIENAERFGLFTLHQLRGRVGRSNIKSYCILISDNQNETSLKRLSYFKNIFDGFKLAKEDLKIRGPGEFWGQKQHGFSGLESLIFLNSMKILNEARKVSLKILEKDPELLKNEHKILKSKILKLGEVLS